MVSRFSPLVSAEVTIPPKVCQIRIVVANTYPMVHNSSFMLKGLYFLHVYERDSSMEIVEAWVAFNFFCLLNFFENHFSENYD